jgi:hypothetical protein
MSAAEHFAPWPEPQHVADMRAALNAVRAYASAHATALGSLANDSISARHVLALLPEEDT